jgi:hypothetical protein
VLPLAESRTWRAALTRVRESDFMRSVAWSSELLITCTRRWSVCDVSQLAFCLEQDGAWSKAGLKTTNPAVKKVDVVGGDSL